MASTEEEPPSAQHEEEGEESESETEEEMRKRHNKETRSLEGQTRAMLKKAPKPKKAQVEAEVKKLEEELAAKHAKELAAKHAKELARFATKAGGGSGGGGDGADGGKGVRFAPTAGGKAEVAAAPAADEDGDGEGEEGEDEAARIARKREKALRKKNKKAEREAEREAEVEKAKEGIVRPRDVEMSALQSVLGPLGYEVLEVQADGHCLYRAVAHQLDTELGDRLGGGMTYGQVRKAAADYMRAHPDDFVPFLDLPDDPDVDLQDFFAAYCRKVEATAEWGGELELRALCHAYRVPITVYSAEAPVLHMGKEYADDSPPLRLTFHRHYYALGEHYNSVIPAAAAAP